MFEIPQIEAENREPDTSTLHALAVLGHVCSEMSVSYQYSQVSLADAQISLGKSQHANSGPIVDICGELLSRKVREIAKFKDGIASLYAEVLMGYTLGLHRSHQRMRSEQVMRQDIVTLALETRPHTVVCEELLESPVGPGMGHECDRQLASAFETVRPFLGRVLEAMREESTDRIGFVITDGSLDHCETVLGSLCHIHRYAESLHFGLHRAQLRQLI